MAIAPNFSQPAIFSEVATPTVPDSGYLKVYANSGTLCSIANGGSEKTYAVSTDLSSYLPLAGGTLTGDLLFTDATYDIGKSGATRPRDGFFSRNLSCSIIALAGATPFAAISLPNNYSISWGGSSILFGSSVLGLTLNNFPLQGITNLSARDISAVNGTTPTSLIVHETYTSATSFGGFRVRANTGAAYQIGSAVGSAGGSNRDLSFGNWDTAGTFASSFYVGSTYAGINDSKIFYVGTSSRIEFSALSSLGSPAIRFAWGGGSPACVYGGSNTLGIGINGFTRLLFSSSSTDFTGSPFTISNTAVATGAYTGFTFTGAAHTNQTASTEATMVNWNLAQTIQFATGALTTQRAFRIQAPTYGFVGASTITTASTLSISGPPVAGTNATITNTYALNVESGASFFGGKITAPATGQASTGGIGNGFNGIDFFGGVMIYLNNSGSPIYPVWCTTNASIPRFKLSSNCLLAWGNSTDASSSHAYDLALQRGGANVLDLRNDTNAQMLRIYNTYTSSTSHEAGVLDWQTEANTLCFGTVKGSVGGSARQLKIITDGIAAITVSTAQAVTMSGNATSQGALTSERYGGDAWFRMRRANGTVASPTQVVTNNTVGSMTSNAYHSGGAFHTTPGGAMYFVATEDATATAQGTEFRLFTTANGGTTNTRRLTIGQDGTYTIGDACNFAFNTSTGTKLGTATTQKIGFWNATPVVQQTTAVASATIVGASGTTLTDADTLDGYTLAQVVKALRTLGILA